MSAARPRYVFVDALRGLAAFAVMLYHFGTNDLAGPLSRVFTRAGAALFERGWIGVHVFFTLSGFVIAHSIGRREMTWPRAARFIVRRQVRLDPPYWLAIAIATAIAVAAHLARPDVPRFVPGARDLVAHVLYVYDLLGLRPIVAVFWSLAIEVQFYLFFVLVLALLRHATRLQPWVVAATGLASLWWAVTWRFPHAWPTQHWYLFALGVLVRWALDTRVTPALPLAFAALYVYAGAHFARLEPVAGGLVAGVLYLAGARDALGRWLAARPLQFLGATSYCIYLFHTIVAGQARWILDGWLPARTPLGALAIFASQIALTLLAAGYLHRTIETWAMRLAGRIRWDR